MEKILVGMNDDRKIILIVYENKIYKINEKEIIRDFTLIEKNHPGFIKQFNTLKSTIILPKEKLNEYLNKINKTEETKAKLEQKINQEIQISNTKIYEKNINKCKEDIITGRQIKLMHSEYNLGNKMYAIQDVGKKRKNQEDSVLILEHPLNKDFKLIAVSDGVGGQDAGELASNHIVKKLTKWFESLHPNMANKIEEIESSLNKMIPNILNDLQAPLQAAATLSAAVVGDKDTLITNIGDSRIYTMKNSKIKQETKDHSQSQYLYEMKAIPNKELIRFNKLNNIITNSISKTITAVPSFSIISNKSYDKIIAVSDGISDCMSEKELENLMQIKEKETMAKHIVNYALHNDSHLKDIIKELPKSEKRKAVNMIKNDPEIYNKIIKGGKDNASIAAYIKR